MHDATQKKRFCLLVLLSRCSVEEAVGDLEWTGGSAPVSAFSDIEHAT
jgi:hypothetical protein